MDSSLRQMTLLTVRAVSQEVCGQVLDPRVRITNLNTDITTD